MKRFVILAVTCLGLSTLLLWPVSATTDLSAAARVGHETTGIPQIVHLGGVSEQEWAPQPQNRAFACESAQLPHMPFDIVAQRAPTCVTPNGKCRLPADHAREGSCCCRNLGGACGYVE